MFLKLLHHQPSARPLASQNMVVKYFDDILPVTPSRHPRCHDQSNLTALLEAGAVPVASFYRWENPVTELLPDAPTATYKLCQQPATGSPIMHPQRGTPRPVVGQHPHMGTACCRSSSTAGLAHQPPLWGCAGLQQGVPISRSGGQNPPRGQGAFWKGCPQAVLPMAMVATHTHTDTASKHHARPRVAAVTPCRGLIPTFPGC